MLRGCIVSVAPTWTDATGNEGIRSWGGAGRGYGERCAGGRSPCWWTKGATRSRFWRSETGPSMKLLVYPDSDAIVVELSDAPYDHSRQLDEDRVIRYTTNGDPIAV